MSADDPRGQGSGERSFDREEANDALRESEGRFRAVVELSPDALAVHRGGRLLYVNPAAVKMVGATSAQELVGRPLLDLVHPDFHQVVLARVKNGVSVASDMPVMEERFVKLDGTPIDVEVQPRPIMYDGMPATLVVVRDVTERRQTELALRQREADLHEAQRLAQIGSWQWTVATDAVTWSEELYRINGRDPELPPPSFAKMAPCYTPAGWARLNEAVGKTLQTGEPYELELDMVHPDGTIVFTSTRGVVDRGVDGGIVGLHGMVQDITARRHAEDEMLKLHMAVDASGEVIFMTDRDGLITFVNPEFTRTYGYASAEVVGKVTPRILKGDATSPEGHVYFWRTLLNGQVVRGELVNKTKDGRLLTIEGSANPVLDERGETVGFLAIQRDITARKQAEEEQARLESQLRQAQKMESVGRLAGGVAHDFNNMLGVIIGHVELACGQVDSAQPLYDDLLEIRRAAERSVALTRQLLAFARKQTVSPRVIDVNETLSGMLTMLKRLIGEDVDLVWRPETDPWPIKMDPSQIDQIVANLCVNARDAIVGVGHITIETKNRTLGEDYCARHPGCVPGDHLSLTVTDDGCGMDEEILSHLFEPFFTTKEVGRGTGLGLATVYGIVKQNDGFIDVVSKEGRGSTFTIHLPRFVGKIGGVGTEAPALQLRRGHETILLVEDEATILKVAARMLESQGYTVLTAATPGEAIRLAAERAGEIQLLMTDVVMPEMNGRDLAKSLLSLYPQLRCLFMSGYAADVIAHHGVLDEGMCFLEKPFSMQELTSKVREALEGADAAPIT